MLWKRGGGFQTFPICSCVSPSGGIAHCLADSVDYDVMKGRYNYNSPTMTQHRH